MTIQDFEPKAKRQSDFNVGQRVRYIGQADYANVTGTVSDVRFCKSCCPDAIPGHWRVTIEQTSKPGLHKLEAYEKFFGRVAGVEP